MLNIVEPTLNSYTGHCYSLVEVIAQALPADQVRVWAGVKSGAFWKDKNQIRPYFFQSIRKIQTYFLYKRLLNEPGKLLVATAGTVDFMMFDWVANGNIPKNKVYFYVHWLGTKSSRASKLAKIAQRQPNLEVMCATESTTDFFTKLGFRATTVAYPRAQDIPQPQMSQKFCHLLVAGAARMDKGFDRIADFVEDLARMKASWPIQVQTSTTHQAKHDNDILLQIDRLHRSGYSNLTLIDKTLPPDDYRALFAGAISIQPYSESDFEDRVSGVTLDALIAGCPLVVTANTWLGRVVLKHNAGVVTSDLLPSGLQKAIDRILLDYESYSHRAAKAGLVLRQEHSAALMIDVIFQNQKVSGV